VIVGSEVPSTHFPETSLVPSVNLLIWLVFFGTLLKCVGFFWVSLSFIWVVFCNKQTLTVLLLALYKLYYIQEFIFLYYA